MPHTEKQLRFPDGRAKALTLSYDDGVKDDIRLIDIMKKHGLKGTFNINAGLYSPDDYDYSSRAWGGRLKLADAVKLFSESGMEVGSHGYTHPHLDRLELPQVTYEIVRDRAELEEQYGVLIRGGAYPYGTYNDETVEALKASGIVYYRTVLSTGKFDIPTDWLRLPATCHHRDARLPELTEKFLQAAPAGHEAPLLFYLWGHSYEFGRDDNWEIIENFAATMDGHDEVWHATNIEVYDYIAAWHQLRFSLQIDMVENPTALDLWFTHHDRTYCVPAGACGKMETFIV